MASITVTTFRKCIKCTYNIDTKQNKLQWKQCLFLLHQKCTNILKLVKEAQYANIVRIIHA